MEISSLINLLIAINKSFDADNIIHANDKLYLNCVGLDFF